MSTIGLRSASRGGVRESKMPAIPHMYRVLYLLPLITRFQPNILCRLFFADLREQRQSLRKGPKWPCQR